MRKYNRKEPLIVIHIPKAAGTSAMKVFESWYRKGFMMHYYDEHTGEMPVKKDLFKMHTWFCPVLLHGHFNKARGFGVEDYYPEVRQFITILRDPFELTLSRFFFTRKTASTWKHPERVPRKELEDFLLTEKPNMLNHFPREVTFDNYRDIIEEFFVFIGITEKLDETMCRIASSLGKKYQSGMLGHYNATERDEAIPDGLRDAFEEKNPLEFEVYRYAVEEFEKTGL